MKTPIRVFSVSSLHFLAVFVLLYATGCSPNNLLDRLKFEMGLIPTPPADGMGADWIYFGVIVLFLVLGTALLIGLSVLGYFLWRRRRQGTLARKNDGDEQSNGNAPAYYADTHPPSASLIEGNPVLPTTKKLAYLQVLQADLQQGTIAVSTDNFTIGRGAENALQLPDLAASREHIRLRYSQGAWFIQDQESTSGTYVNNQVVSACRLVDGDQIKIGNSVFIFHC